MDMGTTYNTRGPFMVRRAILHIVFSLEFTMCAHTYVAHICLHHGDSMRIMRRQRSLVDTIQFLFDILFLGSHFYPANMHTATACVYQNKQFIRFFLGQTNWPFRLNNG